MHLHSSPKGFTELRIGFLALIAATASGLSAQSPATVDFKDGDRVVFLGDTFFEREVDYGFLEQNLTVAHRDRRLSFRNLAWAGDTPLGRARASFDWNKPEAVWLKQVRDQVSLVKPTVAFLSYGTTAALEIAEASPTDAETKAR